MTLHNSREVCGKSLDLIQRKISQKKSETCTKEDDRLNHSSVKESEDFYTNLVTKGPYVSTDSTSILESVNDITWFDDSLIKENLVFHQKYFFYDMINFMSALMLGFAMKPSSAVLLRTGRLHDPQISFNRFLSTVHRFYQFFNQNWDSRETFKHFQTVRKLHSLASRKPAESHPAPNELKLDEPWKIEMVEAMHKDLRFLDNSLSLPWDHYERLITWNPPVPMSQFDMATTQLGVWAIMWLFPKVYGIKDRVQEMRGVIHLWAVISRLLGMKDEFNICLQYNRDPDLYEKMFKEIVLVSLRTVDTTVVTIQASFMDSFSWRIPIISYKSLVYYGLQQWPDYDGINLWNLMTWSDKARVYFYQSIMYLTRNIAAFRIFMNHVAKFWFNLMIWIYLPSNKHTIQ